MTSAVAVWSWLGLWLALSWLVARGLHLVPLLRGKRALVSGIALLVAALLTQIRWFGYPLQFWSASLAANFSIMLIVLLLIWAVGELTGREYFRARDWQAAWIFGAVASFGLYPSALGLGPGSFDAYSLGWPWLGPGSFVLFAVVSVAAAGLFLAGNRFAFLLLAAMTGYTLQFQESINYWDYVLDPVYAAASLVALSCALLRWLRSRRSPS